MSGSTSKVAQLGIESILVLPLFQQHKIAGLFEIFSTQSAAFEERDINALKRIGAMAQKALEGSLRWYEKSRSPLLPPSSRLKEEALPALRRRRARVDQSLTLECAGNHPWTVAQHRGRRAVGGARGSAVSGRSGGGRIPAALDPTDLPDARVRARQDRLRHGFEFLRPREAERTSLQPLA